MSRKTEPSVNVAGEQCGGRPSDQGVAWGVVWANICDIGKDPENWIRKQLLGGTYRPQPPLSFTAREGERPIQSPTLRDRVIEVAILQVIQPKIDPTLSNSVFGRPGRGQQAAIRWLLELLRPYPSPWIVRLDIAKCFERVNVDRAMLGLKQFNLEAALLRVIARFARSGILTEGRWCKSPEGLVQGAPVAPLICNLALSPVDRWLEEQVFPFVRWVDDLVLVLPSEGLARSVLADIERFLKAHLKLELKPAKCHVVRPGDPKAVFLGYKIESDLSLTIPPEKLQRHQKALLPLITQRADKELRKRAGGLTGYYSPCPPGAFAEIDRWLRQQSKGRIPSLHQDLHQRQLQARKRGDRVDNDRWGIPT